MAILNVSTFLSNYKFFDFFAKMSNKSARVLLVATWLPKEGDSKMELQIAFGSRAYCFADKLEDLRAKPVHLVIDEYVELRDENGDYVTQASGKTGRFDLSVREAEFMIHQLQDAIAKSNTKLAEALESA